MRRERTLDDGRQQNRSAALLAAQQHLHTLRRQAQIGRNRDPQRAAAGACLSPLPHTHPNLTDSSTWPSPLGDPQGGYLGWGSQPLTEALCRAGAQPTSDEQRRQSRQPGYRPTRLASDPGQSTRPQPSPNSTVRLFPDLALAMLRRREVTTGRIWLLLRHLDGTGRGWIAVEEARAQLATKGSTLRVCGWRQLRKLLARGEGLFWQRSQDRIWIRSVAKVAAALDIGRLAYRAIDLPLAVLMDKIGQVRAHFYASFHSGRAPAGQNNERTRPIARQTLQRLCLVSRRTLMNYERRAGVRRHFNYAVGPSLSPGEHQEQSWRRGAAVFRYTDYQGKLGRPGRQYTAWQLPNSYAGPAYGNPGQRRPTGQQKRINRAIADLSTKGTTGNGEDPVENGRHYGQRFFASGGAAAGQYGRGVTSDGIYWPTPSDKRSFTVWHHLPGQGLPR